MARCTRRTNLEIHHKRRDGGNTIENAIVLCQDCHSETSTYGTPGRSPEPFSPETKERALRRAGYQCECTSNNDCH